jgi:hypothetical protein
MTLPAKNKFEPQFPIVNPDRRAEQLFRDYMIKLDALVAAMAAGNLPVLVSAVDDAAAAAGGVPIGAVYRTPTTGVHPNTVSTLQVRVS